MTAITEIPTDRQETDTYFMRVMATIRMPCAYIRRKLPNLFLAACVAAVLIFCLNFLNGLQQENAALSENSAQDELRAFGHAGGKRGRHRKKFMFGDDDDDDESEKICQMPKLRLETDANRFAFYKMKPLRCEGDFSDVLFYRQNGSLHINKTILGDRKLSKCEYSAIEWDTDVTYKISEPHVRDVEPFEINVKHDFFRVQCYLEGNKNGFFAKKLLSNKDGRHRKLLDDESEAGNDDHVIHHPRMLGSMGMPDMPDHIYAHKEEKRSVDAMESEQKLDKNAGNNEIKENQDADETGDLDDETVNGDEDKSANDEEEYDDYEQVDSQYMSQDEYYDPYQESNWPGVNMADFDQYFAQVAEQDEVIERVKSTRQKKNSLQMNVLIFAIDSMSHLTYQRKLPKTYAYLRDELKAVILNGYNIVGDATTAAMLPILTGKNEIELPEVRRGRIGSTYVDKFPFVWNKYEQSGYVTLFAEDQPGMGTFQLRFNGFEEKPVDHYIRPFWQAIHDAGLHRASPEWCIGGEQEHTFTLNYLHDFMHKYKGMPKFALGFTGDLTHADNNPGQYIDSDLVAMLRNLKETGYLDNTLLVVMGDHGARYSKVRWTVQGKLEERLPMMSFTFPQSFQKQYPKLYQNLKKNVDRLTTPFDVHETLLDVLDITRASTPVNHKDRGISLLHEIPVNRTCASAHIDMHWCTCMTYEEVKVKHKLVQHAAHMVVDHINSLTKKFEGLCEPLTLGEIKDAKMVIPNEKVLMFVRSNPELRVTNFSSNIELDVIHYQIILVTQPNEGLYEATVQYDVKDESWRIYPDISRINAYGSQPHCILKTLPELRKYCYCKHQKAKS